MAINFDKALGIHQYSLGVRESRAELIAGNLANADTPGYKAKDLDFQQAMANASKRQGFAMQRTHQNHFSHVSQNIGDEKFRIPNQADTGDGNTVEADVERNLYMQNALEYQASLSFLGSKFSGLQKALKGQ